MAELFSFIGFFVKKQRWIFLAIFFCSMAWSLEATLWPYILGRIIDTLSLFDADRSSAWQFLKVFIFLGIALWVFVEMSYRLRGFLLAKALPKMEADVRMTMFDHVEHHSPRYFNEHFAGGLANKISDMVTNLNSFFMSLCLFIPLVFTCLLTLFFLFQVNVLFACILVCWLLIHFLVVFLFAPKCAKKSDTHGEVRSELAGKMVDSLTNNFTVNLFAAFRFEKERIALSQKIEQDKNASAKRYVAWMFVYLSILYIIGTASMLIFLVMYWMKGRISTGEVIQVVNTTWNVTLVMWFASDIMPAFFQSIGLMNQALSVMKDPQDVLDDPEAKPLVLQKGDIRFENVCFSYGKKTLFDQKNVHIRQGEKVGLVGYSGAGKSSFVNLILRFYQVDQGRILIDGQDISKVTLESLRRQVALIPQDPLLFHRTLEENIRYGVETASKEEVIAAAKLAHCDEFIQRLPDGYDSLVGERGTKLSGGERQRIAIARAILLQAPILILDEATSALDSITESFIQESLDTLMKNRTTLVVAHRLSTLAKMDRILVFDRGKIIEQGSHEELLVHQGHYAKLWKMQAGGFLPDSSN
jgi:ATP-binding cassette subfamily B protein